MRWEAANVAQLSSLTTDDAISIRRSIETVEAALARLTKAYSTAMTCIVTVHKLQTASEKEGPSSDLETQSQSLATAARSIFEKSIFMDPLIAKFCPTWTRVAHKSGGIVLQRRNEPVTLTSSSHIATVREIAYLSLSNYSDLLVASQAQNYGTGSSIVDAGVVKHLPLIRCERDFDQDLALVCLCDASDIDGSDPILWLKLACAARRLSNISGEKALRYKRLERHALEMGKTALPPTLPPNRLITRALTEHELLSDEFQNIKEKNSEPQIKLALEIPRYSWSILGRMLMRACQEGFNPDTREAFGSPCVELRLSLLLLLPHRCLGFVCKYLRNEEIWRFEATCRGLSASILSARATLERSEGTSNFVEERTKDSLQSAQSTTVSLSMKDQDPKHPVQDIKRRDEPARVRSSKRVLSQLITSGKRADREAKRRSVQFCLLASILHTTSDDEIYRSISTGDDVKSDSLFTSDSASTLRNPKEVLEIAIFQPGGAIIDSRLGDSSLTAFVDKWSSRNSGPYDVLERYIAHVAQHVIDVFQSDQDALSLSCVIVDCCDLLTRQAGGFWNLDLCSYGKVILIPGGESSCLDYVSVNLLNAELRLKRSDGQFHGYDDYDSDMNFVAVAVSQLLGQVPKIETAHPNFPESRTWIRLKTRLHWMAAGFYLDRSRQSQNMGDSRTAEDFGIEHVEQTIRCLSLPTGSPVFSVNTPHLMSPRRSGLHWKILSLPSLLSFRDEIQASSVVSAARQRFLEQLIDIERHWQTTAGQSIRPEDVVGLLSVGMILLKRYSGTSEADGSKHEELIEDFVAVHESELSSHLAGKRYERIKEESWGSLWFLAPAGAPYIEHLLKVPNLSVLTILLSCLNANEEGRLAVTELMTRVAISSFELLSRRCEGEKGVRNVSVDELDDNMSDDGIFSNDDVDTPGPQRRNRLSGSGGGDHRHEFLVATAVELLVDKIVHMLENYMTEAERRHFATCSDFLAMIRSALTFVSSWYEPYGSRRTLSSTGILDLRIFVSVSSLQRVIAAMNPSVLDCEVAFFQGYSRVLVCQRHLLPNVLVSGNDSRSGRSAKQKEFLGRAELIGAVLSEVALILSRHQSRNSAFDMRASMLINKAFPGNEPNGSPDTHSLSLLVEALLYLWNTVLANDAANTAPVWGRICMETLFVPAAASIIGLCGSALFSFPERGVNDDFSSLDRLSLSEFIDSDGSANEDETANMDSHIAMRPDRRKKILQPLCHSVHCIALVVETVDEKCAWHYIPKTASKAEGDTLFPLVATRVLSSQADLLLSEFGTKPTAEECLWQESFPYGTRTVGTLIDSALHKLYKHLYGFTIHGHWIEKEKVSDDKCKSLRCPESTKAAVQLYRCIQRAFISSRRSVPKAALECVAMALPHEEGSSIKDAIRGFIFNKGTDDISCCKIALLAENNSSWDEPFRAYYEGAKRLRRFWSDNDFTDEIRMVRKGIAKELSQAPLTNISQATADTTKGIKSDDNQKMSEERARAAFQERELSKKFWAILENISYDNPSNYIEWLRAAECITLKAELIADRLGFSKGFVRVNDFIIPSDRRRRVKNLISLCELVEEQQRQDTRLQANWIPFVGDNLAIYVDFQWTSFASLEQCALISSKDYRPALSLIENELNESLQGNAFREIDLMYSSKNYIAWQQAWGGMFVQALRTIALRCLCMGYFLVGEGAGYLAERDATSLQSEILESLGVAKYIALMGSQRYGYPMQPLSDCSKRKIAETARTCFQNAALKVTGDKNQFTFDVLFMVGKCLEKTAKTYAAESFTNDRACGKVKPRMYEKIIARALSTYHESLEEASSLEAEGALPDVQAGGSSHGKAEVFYRLHASRLKCLIAACQYPDNVRDKAIAEAVRLTRCHFYHRDPNFSDEHASTNKEVWNIFADTVSALAQCRIEHQFFHRSVYRHAQALMWAPALHDSQTGLIRGSRAVVPALKGHLIRGLNSSTACADCAEVIMSALFEKRRPQFVSVWVTNASSSPSPMEVINSSTRKFDCLRGKYLGAYVDALRLCKRSAVLEGLFQQLICAKRDLPAFYQSSALPVVRGAPPESCHAKEDLLERASSFQTVGLVRNLKKITNGALARILVEENPSSDLKNDHIKKCYTSFLRLNASAQNLEKSAVRQYGSASPEVEALCQAYLARPDRNERSVRLSDWTEGWNKMEVLSEALALCSALFPSLASSLYRKSKPKKSSSNKVLNDEIEGPSSLKRATPESVSMQFVVDVPQGLDVGDKFETKVMIGSQMKTLRLTVPVGRPPKLKFSLQVPDDEGDSSSKRLKEDLTGS